MAILLNLVKPSALSCFMTSHYGIDQSVVMDVSVNLQNFLRIIIDSYTSF